MRENVYRFIEEYLIDLNASQAALRAGYKRKQTGQELLKRQDVQEAIQLRMDQRADRVQLRQDQVIKEIMDLAFYDPGDFVGLKCPNDILKLPAHKRKAIAGWGWKEGNFVIKLNAKTPSLDQLGRHLKLFTDKVEVGGADELAKRLTDARKRLKDRQIKSEGTGSAE